MKTKTCLLLLCLPVFAFGAANRNANKIAAASAPTPEPTAAIMCPAGANNSDCPMRASSTTTPTTLPASELIFAIEEERVAHDIYAAAAARWNLRVFSSIAEAETRHAAALTRLAATVGVQVPTAKAGVYATAELQALYRQLLTLVNDSATGALNAGALIEETDIADLRRLSAQATDEGSKAIIANLERASVNHLGAFVRNLAAAGVTYQPQVLNADEFSALTSSAPGSGGRGKGKGQGGRAGACEAECGSAGKTPADGRGVNRNRKGGSEVAGH